MFRQSRRQWSRPLATLASPKSANSSAPYYTPMLARLDSLKREGMIKGPLTLTEKILYSHLYPSENTNENIVRGESYLKLRPGILRGIMNHL